MPYAQQVRERFDNWLVQQQSAGRNFTSEQMPWLRMIRDQIAARSGHPNERFRLRAANQEGGIGQASKHILVPIVIEPLAAN